MAHKQIYLDHAAATPLAPAVLAAMQPYFTDNFYNPSASYSAAVSVRRQLEAARTQVAHWFGARPSEIIFTAGGTEADNLAIQGVMRLHLGMNMVVSAIEHDAVLGPSSEYTRRVVPVTNKGVVEVEKLNKLIDSQTVLVSIMYANNEVGSIQPIREIAGLLRNIRKERREAGNKLPLYFHTDACQAAGYLDLHAARLGVDMMTINGGKIYGPKQTGALYVKAGTILAPLIAGGGQENGLRSGTENIAGCVGLATALGITQNSRHNEMRRLSVLQQKFLGALETQIPAAVLNGPRKHRLPNNIHVTIPGQDNESLLIQLDQAGIIAAAGSACSASSEKPSHVLQAMGISDRDAQASLRFTMGRSTTEADVMHTVRTLAGFIS